MSAPTTAAVTSCPPWCPRPADHGPDEARDGGRVHPVPGLADAIWMSFDDIDGWYVEVITAPEHAGDADTVVAALRALAADIEKAAAWLETAS